MKHWPGRTIANHEEEEELFYGAGVLFTLGLLI